MNYLTLFAVIVLIAGSQQNVQRSRYEALLHPLSDQFIDLVNSRATTWQAGRNFHKDTSMKLLRRLMGTLPGSDLLIRKDDIAKISIPQDFQLPENFDSRKAWPYCPTIREIRDQGACGSCWAISSVEVMSDRTCIHSKGSDNFHYSTKDLAGCCESCGWGCEGGWPYLAFQYWISDGIVSGGLYNSSQGCEPYTLPPCEHFNATGDKPKCDRKYHTLRCTRQCEESYKIPYNQDRRRGKGYYTIKGPMIDTMFDIFTRGPVQAIIIVYEDFLTYKSGVYKNVGGDRLGLHAIRIIGYGTENGTPYWLCANSWNSDWGDNGLFKILRGSNECGIENSILGGIP